MSAFSICENETPPGFHEAGDESLAGAYATMLHVGLSILCHITPSSALSGETPPCRRCATVRALRLPGCHEVLKI